MALQTVTVSIQGGLSVAQSLKLDDEDVLPLFAKLKLVLRGTKERRPSPSAEPLPSDFLNRVIQGDCMTVMESLPAESVDCVITSPPYFNLRDYGVPGQIGREATPAAYTHRLVELFRETRRVLKSTGTLWLNLGDSYAAAGNGGQGKKQQSNRGTRALAGMARKAPPGLKQKDIMGIPWRVAFGLQADGWYLRQDIIWHKPNPMPESVTDRCTKSHEYIFLLAKSKDYYFDHQAIKEKSEWFERDSRAQNGRTPHKSGKTLEEGGHQYAITGVAFSLDGKRNKRSVWTVTTKPFKGAHFAAFPESLIAPMVLAGCPKGGLVLDPFMGAGTTAVVAKRLERNYLGIELNGEYIKIADNRIHNCPAPSLDLHFERFGR